MRTRDVFLVVGMSAAAAGAAAFAGVHLAQPEERPDVAAELDERLARIEAATAKAADAGERTRSGVNDLRERFTLLETRLSDVETAQRRAIPPITFEPPQEGAIPMYGAEAGPKDAIQDAFERAKAHLRGAPGEIEVQVPRIVTDYIPHVRQHVAEVEHGIRLRGLPEAERWEKAQEEVGLTDAQVDGLKQAVADRDAALEAAMEVERRGDAADGGSITIKRVDARKAAEAQAEYHRRVEQTLDDNQRKAWREKGYGHAFGETSGRTIFVASTIGHTTELPPVK